MATSPTPTVLASGAPRLTGPAAVRAAAGLGLPAVATGVIARRRAMMGLAERVRADALPLRTLRGLRRRFGEDAPVVLRLPGRTVAVPLTAADAAAVLGGTPEPFTPANREKVGALGPFQPRGVLISRGAVRGERRRFNERVLDTDRPLHRLAPAIVPIVEREAGLLADDAVHRGRLDSAMFTVAWWRIVRQAVLGLRARDDHRITDRLHRLRAAGNWSYAAPRRASLRARWEDELYGYVARPEEGSLAEVVAHATAGGAVDPVGQMPHWLFAFDAAGMASLRALALLAAHPAECAAACEGIGAAGAHEPAELPGLRAAVLESVRLWPTTPLILRDSTEPTEWGGGGTRVRIDAGTAFAVVAGAFHRDADALPFADAFAPRIWRDGEAERHPALVPFSAGPAACPGRNLVLFTASSVLAAVLRRLRLRLDSHPRMGPGAPLPITLNSFGLRFGIAG